MNADSCSPRRKKQYRRSRSIGNQLPVVWTGKYFQESIHIRASSTLCFMTIIGSRHCYSFVDMDLQALALGIRLILRPSDVRFGCLRGLRRTQILQEVAQWRKPESREEVEREDKLKGKSPCLSKPSRIQMTSSTRTQVAPASWTMWNKPHGFSF